MDHVFSWLIKRPWIQTCFDDGLLINLFTEIIADMYRCAHLLHDEGIIPAKIDDVIKQAGSSTGDRGHGQC
jgi:hypothetical protein